MPAVHQIVLATDFSKHSQAALQWAADLSLRYDASLSLLHVVQPVVPYAVELATWVAPPDLDAHLFEDARRSMEQLQHDALLLGAHQVTTEVVKGSPGTEIAEYAARIKADLLVLGTQGHTGLKHLLLGSTAEKLVRTASCPVMTVHAP